MKYDPEQYGIVYYPTRQGQGIWKCVNRKRLSFNTRELAVDYLLANMLHNSHCFVHKFKDKI